MINIKRFDMFLYILSFVLISLVVLGSFYDLEISKSLYLGESSKENLFGVIFAFIGVIPTFLGWSFFGTCIWNLSKRTNKEKRLKIFSVFLFVLSFFFFCNTIYMVNDASFNVPWYVAYPIGIVCIILSSYLGYKISNNSDNPDILRKILYLTVISLIVMLIVMITKEIMCRPRYRIIEITGDDKYYIDWWSNGRYLEKEFVGDVLNDEFSSFPSGHSAYAMFAIFIFPLISEFKYKHHKYKLPLFVIGIVWWLLTALSRITIGAHYLSDVCFAGLITLIIYFIFYRKIRME